MGAGASEGGLDASNALKPALARGSGLQCIGATTVEEYRQHVRHTHTHMHTHTDIHTRTHTHTCTHIQTYTTCPNFWCLLSNRHAYGRVGKAYVFMCVCVCVCMCMCVSQIEPDAAFARRWQPVLVEEPCESVAEQCLVALAPRYQQHHGVTYTQAALAAAVRCAKRYVLFGSHLLALLRVLQP